MKLDSELLYLEGVHETERGWFAVIMYAGIDGNFADVYGESEIDALSNAEHLLMLCKLNDWQYLMRTLNE